MDRSAGQTFSGRFFFLLRQAGGAMLPLMKKKGGAQAWKRLTDAA